MRTPITVLLGALVLLLCASSAGAKQSIYWTNLNDSAIGIAEVDGSAARALITGAASGPRGVSLDEARGKIYWANSSTNTIGVANIDGSNAQALDTSPVTPDFPSGVGVDTINGRVYWANTNSSTIGFANLDGGGGGTLDTGTGPIDAPQGIAVDAAGNRVYWSNDDAVAQPIGYASLDGSGASGAINTAGSSTSYAEGVSVNPAGTRVFWGSFQSSVINTAATDDSGAAQLNNAGASVSGPGGTTVSPDGSRVYWTNYGTNTIDYANADGTGGGGSVDLHGIANGPWSSPAIGTAKPKLTASADFGSGVVGSSSATRTLTLSNTGGGTLVIDSYSIAGVQAGQFTKTDDCGPSLAPTATCTVTVTYTPTSAGAASATLSVNTDEGVVSSALTGTGVSNAALSAASGSSRCVTPGKSRAYKLSYTLSAAAQVTVSFQRRNWPAKQLARCPRVRSGATESRGIGKTATAVISGAAGAQSFSLMKTLGRKGNLKPGRYRVSLDTRNSSGAVTTRKIVWLWVLD